MTKQEQIEEMISAMAASNNPFVDVPIEIMPKVAEALYNAGYRKLDDHAIMVLRKAKGIENRICKETAEKLLNDFKLWAREYQYKDTVVDDNGERPMTNNEKLNYLYTYLCNKYKVEIKE